MSDIKLVDARGLSCPEPALRTRQALQKLNQGTLEVLVDTGTARENVSRVARNAGWTVTIEDKPDGSCRIVMKK